MILVTGGCFQGKTDYACETFHIAKEEAADGMDCPMEAIYETKLLYHFHEYIKLPGAKNHSVVYGVFCAGAGIDRQMMLEHYLYAQTSAIVTNCVKTIPLSQTSGQQLLSGCYGEFDEILKDVMTRSEEDMCLSAPGFDIRGIQHEKLYSRLYMS